MSDDAGGAAPIVKHDSAESARAPGGATDVLWAFLKLGLTSFGGPVAHLGYFRNEFVVRRKWIGEDEYADLVALCQFLPGPASSQVGFALGLLRGGPLGALAAWAAFTLPSAIMLAAFGLWAGAAGGAPGSALVHSLKIVAVAVVAQAVWGMSSSLAPDRTRALIALAGMLIVIAASTAVGQITAIAAGALAGVVFCRGLPGRPPAGQLHFRIARSVGLFALAAFAALLVVPSLMAQATGWRGAALFASFYRSGALVFGGGHVVLPLLRAAVVDNGWVSPDAFLAGYGFAQAVPGPLFTFAAYLGAVDHLAPGGIVGAGLALVAIFLPGLLLVVGALPFWDSFRTRPFAQAAMRGANAAVVGVLGAALYDPVWTSAIEGPKDFALAASGFVLLTACKAPPWIIVALMAVSGMWLRL
ncbi:chromate efflux transporter [Methylocella sp.]|uniref:chromate efflux transporter n=1 Tax=Methylocella sp. TaxID=1978226 RepID=UPI0037852CE4